MIYLDTSVFVSIYAQESRSVPLIALLAVLQEPLAISSWTLTETASALALKVRTKSMTEARRASVAAMIARVAVSDYRRETVEDADFDIAAGMIARCISPLRGGDALHLAVCERLGAKLMTLDNDMTVAASHLGIALVHIP